MNKRSTGTFYEEAAIAYLENHGVKIIDRNVHCGKIGEIDLIGEDSDCLIFIEVKYRSSKNAYSSLQAVTVSKQKTIRRCAEYYLAYKKNDKYVRFDVIGIDGDYVSWIKNAF